MDIWLEILIIFLVSAIVLYIAAYLLGYRLVRRKKMAASAGSSALEQALATSETSGKAATSALSRIAEGVVITDSSLRVKFVNDAVLKMLGLTSDVKDALTFIEVVRDHECNALLIECIRSDRPQASVIQTHLKNQILDVSAFPEKETGSYIVIIRDLTEGRRVEQMRRDLVSNIAHEFRTPIASIRLIAETLLHGGSDDTEVRHGFLQKIELESAKLEQMTNDLHELSLLDRGFLAPDKSASDVAMLIEQCVERLSAQAERKHLTITRDIEAGLPHPVIDRAGIESVLMNLVYNAVKYTNEGGKIVIKAAKEGKRVLVSVSDNGIGIPEDELPRIFERFYKVDKARNTEGSGLGLAISRHIIDLHGGKLWAESVEGEGSTFFFTLPLSS